MKFTEEQIDRLISGDWMMIRKPKEVLDSTIGDLIDLHKKKKEEEKKINIELEIGKCYAIMYEFRHIKIVKPSEKVSSNTYNGYSITLYDGNNIKMEIDSCIVLIKGSKYHEIPEDIFECLKNECEKLINPTWANRKPNEFDIPDDLKIKKRIINIQDNEMTLLKQFNNMKFNEFRESLKEYNESNMAEIQNAIEKYKNTLIGKSFILYYKDFPNIIKVKDIILKLIERRSRFDYYGLSLLCDNIFLRGDYLFCSKESFCPCKADKMYQVVSGEFDRMKFEHDSIVNQIKQIRDKVFSSDYLVQ